MSFAAVGFVWMSTWHLETLEHASATLPLVICGFGFGLALAPVNAAVLAATETQLDAPAAAELRELAATLDAAPDDDGAPPDDDAATGADPATVSR